MSSMCTSRPEKATVPSAMISERSASSRRSVERQASGIGSGSASERRAVSSRHCCATRPASTSFAVLIWAEVGAGRGAPLRRHQDTDCNTWVPNAITVLAKA